MRTGKRVAPHIPAVFAGFGFFDRINNLTSQAPNEIAF
jgi:hypothetical protein